MKMSSRPGTRPDSEDLTAEVPSDCELSKGWPPAHSDGARAPSATG